MDPMTTMTEVIALLRREGYTDDFNLEKNCLSCRQDNYRVFHNEFVIDKTYRFEGESDPADEATVYAISSPVHGIKGILINGAGVYTDEITDEMLNSLKINRK